MSPPVVHFVVCAAAPNLSAFLRSFARRRLKLDFCRWSDHRAFSKYVQSVFLLGISKLLCALWWSSLPCNFLCLLIHYLSFFCIVHYIFFYSRYISSSNLLWINMQSVHFAVKHFPKVLLSHMRAPVGCSRLKRNRPRGIFPTFSKALVTKAWTRRWRLLRRSFLRWWRLWMNVRRYQLWLQSGEGARGTELEYLWPKSSDQRSIFNSLGSVFAYSACYHVTKLNCFNQKSHFMKIVAERFSATCIISQFSAFILYVGICL